MFEFSKSKYHPLEKEMDKVLKDFNLNMGMIYDNSPNVDKVKKRAMLIIVLIIKDIQELFDIGKRFFAADNQRQLEIQTELHKREENSSFNEKNFYSIFQYDYKLFKELWDSYESYDVEKYAKIYRQIYDI